MEPAVTSPTQLVIALASLGAAAHAGAAEPVQKVKPPVSQAYIDLATFSGGIPAAGSGGLLGGLFGGGKKDGGNSFGQTQGQSQGRWMDVTLLTSKNRSLKTATQSVPAGSKLAPTLNLLAPEPEKQERTRPVEVDTEPGETKMPKGKMYLYWGCGAEVRKGQPLVLDIAKLDPAQYSKFFQNRTATFRVPEPAPGRPVWPNKQDGRLLPEGASLAGEHAFAGDGVVDGFKFNLDAAHDLMPAVEASRSDDASSVLFKWKAMPQASGWFVQSMGVREGSARGKDNEMEMVYWTSSELPDMGMGLVNYQPDSAVAKWQKEKVLLPAAATECAAPKEAVSPMAMIHVIAYGDELNLAYPPRPKDPKVTWEPQWDVKVRRKSVAALMPGMGAMMGAAMAGQRHEDEQDQPQQPKTEDKPASPADALKKGAFDVLRGILKK